jgi:hypothetical protein
MAFLCTFSGLLAAGAIWMLLFVELGDATNPVLTSIQTWLSPLAPGGWVFYIALSAGCSWLAYRLLRSRLGGAGTRGPDI